MGKWAKASGWCSQHRLTPHDIGLFQVKFHFQTRRAGDSRIIDDSRKMEKPMELVLGKKFKLEVWELIVQQMSLNEVAKFTVHKSVREYDIHRVWTT